MMCYAVFSGSPHWHAPPTASPQFLVDDLYLIDAGGSGGVSLGWCLTPASRTTQSKHL